MWNEKKKIKATEQHFPVVQCEKKHNGLNGLYFICLIFLFIFFIRIETLLLFESVDKILKCDHSNEANKQYFPVALSNEWVTEQYFPVVLFIMLYKAALILESVDEILKCDHSNESYWAVLSCGAVYYAAIKWLIT